MTTSLGHAASSQVILHVMNAHTATILQGQVVIMNIAITDGNTDTPLTSLTYNALPCIEVIPAVADTAGLIQQYLGVAMADIPVGKVGPIRSGGLVKALTPAATTHAAATVGDVLTVDAAGKVVNAANASHQNPIGLLMESRTAATMSPLVWIFANCINVGKQEATTNTGIHTHFMGKNY